MSIIIGDCHGEYDLLMRLIDQLPHNDLVFVGDLIDRGSQSKDVVEFVKSNNYPCVEGNHEEFLIKSYTDDKETSDIVHKMWDYNGSKATLKSYFRRDVDDRIIHNHVYSKRNDNFDSELFFEHREWMKKLPLLYWIDDKTVVSHSYCLPYLNDKNNEDDILWGRDFPKVDTDIINIFGHTICNDVVVDGNMMCIDTGSFLRGVLSAYDTESGIVYQAKDGRNG